MKQYLSFLFAILPLFLLAQKDYRIHLSNGPIHLSDQLEIQWAALQQTPSIYYEGDAYVLVQLSDIPSTATKATLAQSGIQLLHYIPHYAWVAKLSNQVQIGDLKAANVRAISKIRPEWKMSKNMQLAEIPSHAGDVNNLLVKVLFWKDKNELDYSALCESLGFEIEQYNQRWSWVLVNTDWQNLSKLAAHPLVQFLEWPEKAAEDEFINENALIQSNYISDNPAQGLFFNGTGVDIAVNEGGIVDSAHSPNFVGRLDRTLETGNASGHKTGVGRRMASAGNLDPAFRGTAFGATLHSGGINFGNAATSGISIVNNSFGYGCIGAGTTNTYNSGAETNDNLVRNNPSFMITYSCGNQGNTDCGYGAGAAGGGWGNITGLVKSAKNIFAVGALRTDGTLAGFSSKGPAWDGRILPDICATGPGGTSHASPNLAGVYGQLIQAYRAHNSGITPNSGLLKAILMNTADDMLNPGPDFKTGYGKINARKAYNCIAQNNFISTTIAQSGANTHNLTVPANVKEVRVMLYWTDYEATAGITGRALVNDLDLRFEDPSNTFWQPWVLDPTPDSATLEMWAVRATDTLNNVEQVTLANPAAGTYTLHVDGTMVPQGPQEYFIVYEFIYDELVVTYPVGGEHFVSNSTERLRWDSQGDTSTNFDLAYSLDQGASWTTIATGLSADTRFYDWNIPDTFSSQALIRVERGALSAQSDTTFVILGQVQNLNIVWTCADSSLLYWDALSNVDAYIIYQLGNQYMDSIGFSTNNSYILNNLSLTESEYLAIAPVKNGAIGRRSLAIERAINNINCTPNDVGMLSIINPSTFIMPSCASGNATSIEVSIRNWGTSPLTYVPLAFSLNAGTPILDTAFIYIPSGGQANLSFATSLALTTGSHDLEIWTHYPNDGNISNDTLSDSLIIYNSTAATLPISESFDTFSTCSTAWGCASISCPLSSGWYNVVNIQGDSIDWRTDANGTGTGGTGPAADHTTGTGNYLYLEGSGNNGAGCTNKMALLHSPCIDLTNTFQPELYFWYHANGGGIGSLHVDVISNGALHEDVIPFVDGPQGNQWDSLWVDLTPFVGSEIVVVFRGYTGNGFAADLAIDDINIYDNNPTSSSIVSANKAAPFSVYPNPSSGRFIIDFGGELREANLVVTNVLGQQLESYSIHSTSKYELNITGATGVYFVQIELPDGSISTLKLVKE